MTDVQLLDLIDQLTRDQQTPIAEVHGIVCLRPDPPLLVALAEARTANIGQGSGASARHERITLNLQASELHTAIARRVRAWATAIDVPRHWTLASSALVDWTDPAQLLRAWHARAIGDARLDLEPHAQTIAQWVHQIRDLVIDPPRRAAIEAPCPECGVRWVRLDEEHTTSALVRSERDPMTLTDVICRNCGARWVGLDGPAGLRALRIAIDERGAA